MLQIKAVPSLETLNDLKRLYLKQTTAPLDGMWLCGFVPMATHYGFYKNGQVVGYCCLNDDGYLLQFYLRREDQSQSSLLFDSVLNQATSPIVNVKGAFVSTAEPLFLSLCLDHFDTFSVNSLMYQLDQHPTAMPDQPSSLSLTPLSQDRLADVVEFAKANTGGSEEFLAGYYTHLINREEAFGYWQHDRLLALGDSRGYVDYQTAFADLGVIVDQSIRGKGLGTEMLKRLIRITEAKGLVPICSTERSNLGAQKAICRAGFFARHRIIKFDL